MTSRSKGWRVCKWGGEHGELTKRNEPVLTAEKGDKCPKTSDGRGGAANGDTNCVGFISLDSFWYPTTCTEIDINLFIPIHRVTPFTEQTPRKGLVSGTVTVE